jgi:hypothetical protein
MGQEVGGGGGGGHGSGLGAWRGEWLARIGYERCGYR